MLRHTATSPQQDGPLVDGLAHCGVRLVLTSAALMHQREKLLALLGLNEIGQSPIFSPDLHLARVRIMLLSPCRLTSADVGANSGSKGASTPHWRAMTDF